MKEIVLQIQEGFDNCLLSVTCIGEVEGYRISHPCVAEVFDIHDMKSGDTIRIGNKLFMQGKINDKESTDCDEKECK